MASPAYVSFMTDDKPIEGSVVQPGKQGTSLVIAFQHAVLFTGTELFTGNPVREHKPVLLIKVLDKSSITLYQLLTRGTFIEKATIDWYRFNEKSKKDEIYFQHILEKVKITSIRLIMPHIKNPQFERNVHMEEVALRYDRIAWVYPEGNIRYTDRWLYAFLLGGMNKSEQKEWDALMGKEAATDDFADWLDERKKEKKKVKIHLVDSSSNILADVKITLQSGGEYDTDQNGDVEIELQEEEEEVTVTRIEWPKEEEGEGKQEAKDKEPAEEKEEEKQPINEKEKVEDVSGVVAESTEEKTEKEVINIHLVDENDKPFSGVKVTIHTGDVFVTDENGDIVIEKTEVMGAEVVITKIEFIANSEAATESGEPNEVT